MPLELAYLQTFRTVNAINGSEIFDNLDAYIYHQTVNGAEKGMTSNHNYRLLSNWFTS